MLSLCHSEPLLSPYPHRYQTQSGEAEAEPAGRGEVHVGQDDAAGQGRKKREGPGEAAPAANR